MCVCLFVCLFVYFQLREIKEEEEGGDEKDAVGTFVIKLSPPPPPHPPVFFSFVRLGFEADIYSLHIGGIMTRATAVRHLN